MTVSGAETDATPTPGWLTTGGGGGITGGRCGRDGGGGGSDAPAGAALARNVDPEASPGGIFEPISKLHVHDRPERAWVNAWIVGSGTCTVSWAKASTGTATPA